MSDTDFGAHGPAPRVAAAPDVPHFTGWVRDPAAVRAVTATLPRPLFGDAARPLAGSGAGKTTLLYKAFKEVNGEYLKYPAQTIGDCVSHGFGHGVDLLEAVQIAIGKKAEAFKQTSTEAVYGLARVDIGGERGSYSDGAVGAWAAKAVSTLGTLSRDVTGPYDGRKAKEWGARSIPAELRAKVGEHKVKTVSLVTTFEELEDALANGYPVPVCSNQGFTMTRDETGSCRGRGHWGHCCPPDAMIAGLTPKRADEVQVGDEVLGHDGKLHKVVASLPRHHRGEMTTVHVVGLPPVRFTPEHPLLVEREVLVRDAVRPTPAFSDLCRAAGVALKPVVVEHVRVVREWVEAGRLRPGDSLLMPASVQVNRFPVGPAWDGSHPLCRNIPSDFHGPDEELAWLFGLYIANGHSTPAHRVTITLPASKPWLADRASAAFRSLGLEPVTIDEGNHVRVRVDSAIVADSFKRWFGGGDAEKRIPEFLFDWPLDRVIDGIHAGDGDGSTNLKRARIYTTSRTLLAQLWMILTTTGRRPTVNLASRSAGTYANARPLYSVNFARDVDDGPRRKRHHTGYRDGYYVLPVKTVESSPYDGMVYNWEVEGSNSYVADGVAVHNCMLIVGVRQSPRRQACIFQSWGSMVPDGPIVDEQPDNSFWADADVVAGMLAARDSWALSSFDGYPGQPLPSAWSYAGFA